jgi:hypothetical protein
MNTEEILDKFDFEQVSNLEIYDRYTNLDPINLYRFKNYMIVHTIYDTDFIWDDELGIPILEFDFDDWICLDEFLGALLLPYVRKRKLKKIIK